MHNSKFTVFLVLSVTTTPCKCRQKMNNTSDETLPNQKEHVYLNYGATEDGHNNYLNTDYNTFHNNGAVHRERKLTQVSDRVVFHSEETKSHLKGYTQCPDLFSKEKLHQKLPVTQWLPKYDLSCFVSDAIAGITVGLTVIPQGIAYAGVAELPAQVCNT